MGSQYESQKRLDEKTMRCQSCGKHLPCVECARAERRRRKLVGKEPRDGATDVLSFDAETLEALRRIREEGFTDSTGLRHEPWDEAEYRRRSGEAESFVFPHEEPPPPARKGSTIGWG